MEKKLIGSDGALFIGQYGTEVIAAAVLEKGKFYEVTAIGASTAFPAGAAIGYLVQGDGVITLAADDIALPFDGVKMCDITTWSMDFSKSEIDVSTFCSENKEYRASKYDDITGQLEGIMVTDITDQPDAIMNHFVSVVDESTGTYTINPKSEVQVLAQLVTDDSDVADDIFSFYFTPVVLTGFSASAGGDNPQAFSSPFRIGTSEAGVTYYKFPVLA